MRLSGVVVALAAVFAVSVVACGDDDSGGDSAGKVQVVTTLPLIADFVREVGRDRVDVTALLPSGSDPHTYEPAPRDVQEVSRAEIAFANGLDLEQRVLRLIEANLPDGAPLVKLGEEVAGETGVNPHLWLDMDSAREYVRLIRENLARVDPDGDAQYQQNLEAYLEQLDETDSYVIGKIETIPPANRKLVTTHDAFDYLADYAGLEVVAFVAEGPGQEPSPGDVADLGRAIENEQIPAVFSEPQTGAESRVLEQAAEDAGVETCTLYSDSLDDRVRSYVEIMRFNADDMARCLGDAGGD